jgi:hypothetical protein
MLFTVPQPGKYTFCNIECGKCAFCSITIFFARTVLKIQSSISPRFVIRLTSELSLYFDPQEPVNNFYIESTDLKKVLACRLLAMEFLGDPGGD